MSSEKNKNEEEINRKIRADVLAQRVGMLFQFCGQLIPDIDLLEEISKYSEENHQSVMAMYPIISALGKDPESSELMASINRKRSEALLTLVRVLKETEVERIEYQKKQAKKVQMLRGLGKMFGEDESN